MILVDLFCGAGGAAKGYHDAGFTVIGVDLKKQPEYPYTFIQADAIEFIESGGLEGAAAVHASPPCQKFSRTAALARAQGKKASEIDLLTPIRPLLLASGLPLVIENVPGAPLIDPVQLCGSSFGLKVQRHRLFETNWDLAGTKCDHQVFDRDEITGKPRPWGIYYSPNDSIPKGGRTARDLAHGRELMGIDWMSWKYLRESIPPAYTEYIGMHLRAHILKGK